MSFSDGTEPAIVGRLRADGDLVLSLVATEHGAIVGHVAFSPASVGETPNWFALGPVSVAPARQRQGIGTGLIRDGLGRIEAQGAAGCVLVGDPAYYTRFGFQGDGALTWRDLPRTYVQWLSFGPAIAEGEITFSPGLEISP